MVQSVLVDVNEARTDAAPEDVAALLRERIYGGIACLSTLLLLLRYPGEEPSAWPVVLDVVVATGSLWAASLLADLVAHLAAHGVRAARGGSGPHVPRVRPDPRGGGRPAGAARARRAGRAEAEGALRAGVWVSVITLGLFALLAARRTKLAGWKRLLIVAALIGLGALVVLLKTLAH